MMKKTYIIPEMSVVLMQHETSLAVSGVSSNNGIGYGGVDDQGQKDPDVKANPFDFEWE
jgi:hypothetical protein